MLYVFFALLCFFPSLFFFFNDTATTEIYTLSLHDALPISMSRRWPRSRRRPAGCAGSAPPRSTSPMSPPGGSTASGSSRSEEHTSELQSLAYLVCRLLLEKKKKKQETKTNLVVRPGDSRPS